MSEGSLKTAGTFPSLCSKTRVVNNNQSINAPTKTQGLSGKPQDELPQGLKIYREWLFVVCNINDIPASHLSDFIFFSFVTFGLHSKPTFPTQGNFSISTYLPQN